MQTGFANFTEFMELAPKAQTNLGEKLKLVAQKTGLELVLPAVKTRERTEAKLNTDARRDFRRITDVCRATLATPEKNGCHFAGIPLAYEELKADIVFAKNKFANPQAHGYSDVNALLKVSACPCAQTSAQKSAQICNKHMLCELQLHLHPLMKKKVGPNMKFTKGGKSSRENPTAQKMKMKKTSWRLVKN